MQKQASTALLTLILFLGCSSGTLRRDATSDITPLVYEVNLNDRADDLFKVKLTVDDLSTENAVYQFAATAPGTYQVMDIGRYVRKFRALDTAGGEIPVEQITTNQWRISRPQEVRTIEYEIAETWDTPVDSNQIFAMAGSSLEEDHAQINGQCVFGYPTGMQQRPVFIKLLYPESWLLGTALNQNAEGYYVADDYDQVVDSPILLGRLTKASLKVKGSKVEIYTYSKTDKVTSDMILESVKEILNAEAEFMEGLPVKRYTFLFHFEDANYGAWEHSYSSTYAYGEEGFENLIQSNIPAVVAHEFFHIVTPLNIHSEIIQDFNFVTPVPSEHLWLYEGVTEWAAHILELRGDLISLDNYLAVISQKLKYDDNFDKTFSLSDLAQKSYKPAGQKQYANIYMRGALVAGLLDILILDKSGGKRGLREVINELAKIYGPEKSFPDAKFYDIVTAMTYPEIGEFFEKYVKSAEPLPLESYYGKLGIDYTPVLHTGEDEASVGYSMAYSGSGFVLNKVSEKPAECGLMDGDEVVAYNGEPLDFKSARSIFNALNEMAAGDEYEITVKRGEEELTVTCTKIMREKLEHHVLTADPNATAEQLKLRKAWMKNL